MPVFGLCNDLSVRVLPLKTFISRLGTILDCSSYLKLVEVGLGVPFIRAQDFIPLLPPLLELIDGFGLSLGIHLNVHFPMPFAKGRTTT